MFLLFPGRHLLHTRFQQEYLSRVMDMPISQLNFLGSPPPANEDSRLETIIFAITSNNQDNSRYNPVSRDHRLLGTYKFAKTIQEALGTGFMIVGLPDYGRSDRFARMTITEIEEQTGKSLTPENTAVLCSTPSVIKLYQAIGFSVLPAELSSADPQVYSAMTPMELVKRIGELGDGWSIDETFRAQLSPSTLSLFRDFPVITQKIGHLYTDLSILTDQGSLTEERDYDTYAIGMGNREIIRIKYEDIRHCIVGGRIADEGCADGSLLMEIAKDFPDSDLLGVDITKEFIARCEENMRQHRFSGAYIRFKQANILSRTFPDNSIDTTVCNSTMHELWSYAKQADSIRQYLANKFQQTRKGGRIVIRDVVGPEDKETLVYMLCNDQDGLNENVHAQFENDKDGKKLAAHIGELSTYSRFLRFAEDYLTEMRRIGKRGPDTRIGYDIVEVDGKKYFVTTLKNACEFMSKKDYTDNWASELNEEFAHYSFSDYKRELESAGFTVLETPNEPMKGSRTYCSQWQVNKSLEGKVSLYSMGLDNKLHQIEYPVTNIVIAGEKR